MSNPAACLDAKTTGKPPESGKRRSVRHRRPLKASWRLLGARDHRFASGTVQDISRHGVALVVEEALKAGAFLSIQLEGVAEQFAGPWLGRVENTRPLDGQAWVVGCAFSVEFAEGELRALLESACQPRAEPSRSTAPPPRPEPVADPFVQGSAKERRSSARRGGQAVAVIIARANAHATRLQGLVVDRSLGGLALSVPCPLAMGATLKIRAAHVSETTPWTPVRVKNCRCSGRQWTVGCQFLESLPSSVLLSFC